MSILSLKPKQASMVWLEPHFVHAGGQTHPLEGDGLASALALLGPGPTHWVVDDAWIPAVLIRDLVEVPSKADAREAFFRWRYGQLMATETPSFVQAENLGATTWLVAGMTQALRDRWLQAAQGAGHPMRSLIPRWLWLYKRLAPSLHGPGLLLSLCPTGDGAYSGTLVAWGRELILLRQWAEPAVPEAWNRERIVPTVAYLQRDAHSPQEVHLWGAPSWPEGPVPIRQLAFDPPALEDCR